MRDLRRLEKNRIPLERGRRFVPGVTAGIYYHPNDRPLAETHPPNDSINVYLVNSPMFHVGKFWRLVLLLLYGSRTTYY